MDLNTQRVMMYGLRPRMHTAQTVIGLLILKKAQLSLQVKDTANI